MTAIEGEVKTSLSGSKLFFEAARQYGLTHVFGNPGTTEVSFMDGVFQSPEMQFFLCLHEDVATGAADGFARISGRPAIVNVHLQPGLTHGLANLHNAKKARVPVIVTVGEHHTRFSLEDGPLSGDILSAAQSLCKWSHTVRTVEELPMALHRAMLQAMSAPRGPVCLVLSQNLLSQMLTEEVYIPALNIPKPGPAHPQAIEEAARFLNSAQRPMLIVGDVETMQGRQAIVEIAHLTGASIWREPFPTRIDPSLDPIFAATNNRLPYFPKQRRQILQSADCLLLAGVSGFTTHFLYDDDTEIELVPPSIPVIHLDADVAELGKNARHALPLLGDVDLTLENLRLTLSNSSQKSDQLPVNQPDSSQLTTRNSQLATSLPDDTPITAAVLGKALRQAVPAGTIFVNEAITSGTGIEPEFVNGNTNLSHILTGRGGSLGYGIPAAIGAQLAAPGKPVLAVIGDGTAIYSIQALWTLARYKLPVVTVICSNRNYDIITLEILRAQGKLAEAGPNRIKEYTALTPPNLNFAALAEGFGVAGRQLTKPSELVPALEWAFSLGAPALLDVIMTGAF